ncbi:MAG TPA: hypothetical protein VFQ67_10955 [Allosphingosinicella sp.]|jgi:hypothetical protein|nr:hypothetical protein [Allosphingosinicella sp.]
MRRPAFLLCLALAACGEPATVANRAAQDDGAAPEEAVVTPQSRPVRIGELGANFQACGAAGTTRNLKPGEALPVRSAPFDDAVGTGRVESRARFFICTRSLDQKWFGIVFDQGGALAERCGVSEPVTRRRDYDGPCRSGWVESAFVKVIAGDAPTPASPAETENVSEADNSTHPGA